MPLKTSPIASGSWTAILAAVLFGVTTPLVERLGAGAGPVATATLLYAGAALGAGVPRAAVHEAGVSWTHAPRLVSVALCGAVVAPSAFAWGLQRSGALAGSLSLNLEALFTVGLAVLLYREAVGWRVALACGLMLVAGTLLAFRRDGSLAGNAGGMAALAGASLGWALDNTLTRPLSELDPRSVVFWKALLGAGLSSLLAWQLDDAWPSSRAALGLVACGASGYGLSLRLYLRAQRVLGAARTGSLFALAPFLGAALAFAAGDREGAVWIALAASLFGLAAYLHVSEQHDHRHVHDAIEHEHAHRHDDGHHEHVHEPPVQGSHTHRHQHEAVEHDHSHGADLHHRHRH